MNQSNLSRSAFSRRSLFPGLLASLLIPPLFTAAEQPQSGHSKPPASGTLTVADPRIVKPGDFYDEQLNLHFNYPMVMRNLDANTEMESGHQALFGKSGAGDPEHEESKRCFRPLLVAELPSDKAPARAANMDGVWVDDTKEYKDSRRPVPIFARILLVEVPRNCIPKKLLKSENDLLGNLTLSTVSAFGIQPMATPLLLDIGGQKLHINSGASRPVVNGHLSPAPIFVLAVSTSWRDHVLLWTFLSNDTEALNGITKSRVQFGNGTWGVMFPADVGPLKHP